jgi:MFS family permease
MLDQLQYSFRAFTSRNFRLFFLGQLVSLTGTWMQRVAMGWLVYRLTESPLMLGVIGFTNLAPTFFLGPIGGVLADRWDRHRTLQVTQTIMMVQAVILTALALSGVIAVWHIIVLGAVLGTASAIEIPVRQAFVVQLISRREDLSNAIALNSTGFNLARLIGPSLAGILTAIVGEWLCFLINGITFSAVLVALLFMDAVPHIAPKVQEPVLQKLAEGIRYAWGYIPIRAILLLIAVSSLFGLSYGTLLPVFARDVLNGGADMLGWLMSSAAIGAITGAIYLASRREAFGIGSMIPVAVIVFACGIFAFSLSTIPVLSMGIVAVIGLGQQIILSGCNTIVQTVVDDDKRGRVMSLFVFSVLGMAPFGSLLAGAMAQVLGTRLTLCVDAVIVFIGAVVFWSKVPMLRKSIGTVEAEMKR